MRIERTRRDPTPEPGGAADLRHDRHALVGRLADLRQRPGVRGSAPRPARAASSGSTRTAMLPRDLDDGARPHRRRRQLLARARAPAHALHARAQRDLRPARAPSTRLGGRRALRHGAARQRGADGEDPHRRVDAGDHRPPDDAARDARQLVGPRSASGSASASGDQLERGAQRHPRLADRPPRRPVLADRGVRRRLPDAPAAPGRLHLPLGRRRRGARRSARSAELGALARARAGSSEIGDRRTPSTRSASRTRARSRCTTTRASCRSFDRAGRDAWSTSPRSTSCASASAACRATTSSAGSST